MSLVEGLGFLRNGMDKNGADPNGFGRCGNAQNRVAEKIRSDAFSLPLLVNGKATNQDGWYRFGHVAPNSTGGDVVEQGVCRKTVEPNDTGLQSDDECP